MKNKTNIGLITAAMIAIVLLNGCIQGKCGDGFCQKWEEKRGSCSKDCVEPERSGYVIIKGNEECDSIKETETNYLEDCEVTIEPVCGDGICDGEETTDNCEKDCCSKLYIEHEKQCLDLGWNKLILDVNGLPRKVLWKGPEQWTNGAIITLHGGSGTYSNFCYNIALGQPAVVFSNMAIEQGFAVFSLDSTFNLIKDDWGVPVGKRWGCMETPHRENIDLSFIEKAITETIPDLRPSGSSDSIFMTGISNGGFMTILASTHFDDKITAFAPVAAGDPYGTYFNGSFIPKIDIRNCASGAFVDIETNININLINACVSSSYPNEIEWVSANPSIKPSFKQFHHSKDGVCDISCMEKVQEQLIEHGYKNDGDFILDGGFRSILKHSWQKQYNQPILDFFKKHPME